MMKKEDLKINIAKADSRIKINLSLLAVCFTIFALIISIKPGIFENNLLLTLQLVLAIPFLISANFAHSKLVYSQKFAQGWNKFGYINFIIAYSFLINVIGILLSLLVSATAGMIFFIINIILAVTYSFVDVLYEKEKLKTRLYKDIFFALMLLLLGILPSLGVY